MEKYTPHSFNQLEPYEKYEVLQAYGVPLDLRRTETHYVIMLISLHGFYVELWYNTLTDSVTKASAITAKQKLDLYFSQVDISDITSLLD